MSGLYMKFLSCHGPVQGSIFFSLESCAEGYDLPRGEGVSPGWVGSSSRAQGWHG